MADSIPEAILGATTEAAPLTFASELIRVLTAEFGLRHEDIASKTRASFQSVRRWAVEGQQPMPAYLGNLRALAEEHLGKARVTQLERQFTKK